MTEQEEFLKSPVEIGRPMKRELKMVMKKAKFVRKSKCSLVSNEINNCGKRDIAIGKAKALIT